MKIKEVHRIKVENRGYRYIGSYVKGEYTIDKRLLLKRSSQYIRVKCPYCGAEYDVQFNGFINRESNCSHCCNKYENSFAYYIQVELGEPLNKYWDWEKNTVNPYHIHKNRCGKSRSNINTKVWIKCTDTDYHGSYDTSCAEFARYKTCPYCSNHRLHPKDSFAQYHIDNTDPNFLEKYWSDKNTLNPWKLSKFNKTKVLIRCKKKDYHDEYLISCGHFTTGKRCPLCCTHKGYVHPKDSFGALYPEKAKYWSDKNKKTPFEVTPFSNVKYTFVCEECGNDFDRILNTLNRVNTGVKCRSCNSSKGEVEIKNTLESYNFIKNEGYIPQKEFEGLIGLGGRNLSYDFYLPDYNLLIEYQGEFHDGNNTCQSKKDIEKQKEHDKRKRDYAESNSLKLLEIWYWDYDHIEEILSEQLIK